jgi:hypothetical protein
MKKYLFILIPILFILQSCKPNADGLFRKIENETGFKVKPNLLYEENKIRDKNTKSGIIEVAYDTINAPKIVTIKRCIDNYLKVMPTVEETGKFDYELSDYYEWENTEFEVTLRVRWKDDENLIYVLMFFTEK